MKIRNIFAGMGLATVILATSIVPSTVKAAVGKTPAFDPDYYVSRYWDLKGMNADEAHKHFMTYGLKEGRSSSPVFDVKLYKELNWDLAGLTNEQAYNHFINYGMKEGRKTSIVFDADYYSKSYWEGSISKKDTYMDFINNGLKEGRASSPVFDVEFYKLANWDLQNMSNEEAYAHFLAYGIKEGRTTSSNFNVKDYKKLNWDLANMTYEQAYNHYIKYGRFENRNTVDISREKDLTNIIKLRYEKAINIEKEIEDEAENNNYEVSANFVDKRILSDTFTKKGWDSFKEFAGIVKKMTEPSKYMCNSYRFIPTYAKNVKIKMFSEGQENNMHGYISMIQDVESFAPDSGYCILIYEITCKQENGRWLIDEIKQFENGYELVQGEPGSNNSGLTIPEMETLGYNGYKQARELVVEMTYDDRTTCDEDEWFYEIPEEVVNEVKDKGIFTEKGFEAWIEYFGLRDREHEGDKYSIILLDNVQAHRDFWFVTAHEEGNSTVKALGLLHLGMEAGPATHLTEVTFVKSQGKWLIDDIRFKVN